MKATLDSPSSQSLMEEEKKGIGCEEKEETFYELIQAGREMHVDEEGEIFLNMNDVNTSEKEECKEKI